MGQCTAKSKRTGERCRRAAMHGQTVCYMHGGASRRKGGAPKGSKNALKTGQYETILASTMTPEELSYRDSLDINPLTTLRETLKTLRMRELRRLTGAFASWRVIISSKRDDSLTSNLDLPSVAPSEEIGLPCPACR